MRASRQRAIEGVACDGPSQPTPFPPEGVAAIAETHVAEGARETSEVRRRHKRSRHQQREVGPFTSQSIIAPIPMEPLEGTPLASPPASYPLEPGELPNEEYHSVAMSGAPDGAGWSL